LLELRERVAKDKGHRLCAQAEPGDPDAVDQWPQQGAPGKPQSFYALTYLAGPGCEKKCQWLMKIQIISPKCIENYIPMQFFVVKFANFQKIFLT
jgi:hypothetical protein